MHIKSQPTFPDIRVKQGYSVTALAKAMNVSPATVLGIEKGRSINPATAKKACETLRMTFDELFTIK